MATLIFIILLGLAAFGANRFLKQFELTQLEMVKGGGGPDSYGKTKNKAYAELARKGRSWVVIVSSVLTVLILLWGSIVIVQDRTSKTPKLFGKYKEFSLLPGIHFFQNPFYSYTEMNTGQQTVHSNDADKTAGMLCTTKDENPVTVESNFSFRVNGSLSWWLLKNIGDNAAVLSSVINPKARSSTRDAFPEFSLQECLVSKKQQLSLTLENKFRENIYKGLTSQGAPKNIAEGAIQVLPVDVQSVVPDPKVQNALAEKKATEIEEDRQKVQTRIAIEVGTRRAEEGKGVRKLFDELPKGFSPQDVAIVLDATSRNKRADAFVKLAEEGKVTSIVFEGDAATTK